MQLEIKEDGVAARHQRLNHGRAGGDKQLQPHLEPLAVFLQLADQGECRGYIGHVEGHNQALAGLFNQVHDGWMGGAEAWVQSLGDGHTFILWDYRLAGKSERGERNANPIP